jgi:hypothetical protein
MSGGRGCQVDALLKGVCRDLRTSRALVFVLPRLAILVDEVAVAVRHVRGGVCRPQGAEAVRPLPIVACACGAQCSLSGIHPGYSCKEGRIVEDGLLVEFPCTPTRTRSVYSY